MPGGGAARCESGSATRQKIFNWGMGLGAQKYANHTAGRANSPWLNLQLKLADALVFKKIRARTGGDVWLGSTIQVVGLKLTTTERMESGFVRAPASSMARTRMAAVPEK